MKPIYLLFLVLALVGVSRGKQTHGLVSCLVSNRNGIRYDSIALWTSVTKFTVCGRDGVEASNCEFWNASTQSDLVCSCSA